MSCPACAINYDPAQARQRHRGREGHWHVDSGATRLGREEPGPPEHGGCGRSPAAWSVSTSSPTPGSCAASTAATAGCSAGTCCLRGASSACAFTSASGSPGSSMKNGTPATAPERVWGWCYQTLEGHLEQGRLSYEVIKHLTTGEVAFRVAGYSRPAPIRNPVDPAGASCFSAGGPSSASTGTSRLRMAAWSGSAARPTRCRHRGTAGRHRAGAVGSPAASAGTPSLRGGFTRELNSRLRLGRKRMMTTKTTRRTEQDLLAVYLNDHLAGATVGLELTGHTYAASGPLRKPSRTAFDLPHRLAVPDRTAPGPADIPNHPRPARCCPVLSAYPLPYADPPHHELLVATKA